MNKLSEAPIAGNGFYDIQGLNNLREAAQKDEKGALGEVAKQFEAMFTGMLIKSMRQANEAFETDSPFNNNKTKFYRDMQDQQMALELSSTGSMGLAEVLTRQLDPSYGHIKRDSDNPLIMPVGRSGQSADLQHVASLLASRQQQLNGANVSVESKPETQADTPAAVPGTSEALMAELSQADLAKMKASREADFSNPTGFVQTLMPFAKEAAKELGVNPSVLVAQAALETGWGKKVINRMGESSFNLFNIKADRRWEGQHASIDTLEYYDGVAVKERARFRVYNNFEQSFNDYVNFLQTNPRYKKALQSTDDAGTYMRELQRAGYATDPSYANKVMSVLKRVEASQGSDI
ncbi:flagellar assembly peptidoglycan hydrolase FlgJ [Motilimonas pumila]|uniref:Peptidoglycan hydrolase FlgJ n=1 Tax=Motilimonas pumila TaxID=2303987 RepID=A0A418YGP6_9GAMM|nr:flagellar assembly peptidoglycan hydrolase FlgJ [Motilimonas pumila]RJG48993.1 flagellar assembly peptidoglycan hydrolase FlgJ [Motilimonas pumila]